jgi:hypothetical protein
MGTRAAALRGNAAKRGGGSGGGDRATAAMKGGGGVSVGYGATFTQGKGVVSGNTAGDGADVHRR